MTWLLISITCGINAWIYCTILIKQGHLLHGFYCWYERKLTTEKVEIIPTPPEVLELLKQSGVKTPATTKRTSKKSHWLMKPLGGCVFCTAGQMALWAFIVHLFLPSLSPQGYMVARTAWYCITVICTSILLVTVMEKQLSSVKS